MIGLSSIFDLLCEESIVQFSDISKNNIFKIFKLSLSDYYEKKVCLKVNISIAFLVLIEK